MSSPFEDLLMVLRLYSKPFIGFTMQPHIYYLLLKQMKPDTFTNEIRFPVPTFCVSNQPCPIVKWTSQKQMMKFVRRKDSEF